MFSRMRPLQFARDLKSAQFCLDTASLPRDMTEKVYVQISSLFA